MIHTNVMAKKKKLSAVTEQKKLAFKVQRSKFLFPILGGTDEGSFIWNAISAIFLEHSNISLHFSRFFSAQQVTQIPSESEGARKITREFFQKNLRGGNKKSVTFLTCKICFNLMKVLCILQALPIEASKPGDGKKNVPL